MDVNMWEAGNCDLDCQCDGLIPESFRIGKRRHERTNMSDSRSPLARTLDRSPYLTPSQRTVLGRIENSPRRSAGKISRLLEDRRRFTTMDKENLPDNCQRHRKGSTPGKEAKRSFGSKLCFQTGEKTETFLTERSSQFFRSETQSFHSETTRTSDFFERKTLVKSETVQSDRLLGSETSEFFQSKSSFFQSALTMDASRTDGLVHDALSLDSPVGRGRTIRKMRSLSSWTLAQVSADSPDTATQGLLEELSSDSGYPPSGHKPSSPLPLDESTLDFAHALPPRPRRPSETETATYELPTETKCETRVPGSENEEETEFETLHDLEDFETDNFDSCTTYEIISTDSPNIISRGSSTRTITSKNLVFGAPISETERSTSFNTARVNPSATRMLNFDDEPSFEFTSPATLRPRTDSNVSVKKALKFSETPKKNALRHERSDSSIGSASTASPVSSTSQKTHGRLRLFNSESTNSMESGFASEIEDTFLFDAIEPEFNSPKVANFCDLISGQIKDQTLLPVTEETMDLDITETSKTPIRPNLFRSISLNPDTNTIDKVRLSLFKSSLDSPTEVKLRGFKRPEPPLAPSDDQGSDGQTKRRRSNCEPLAVAKRPVLQRALSENSASIMSALARSAREPDLIGDFSRPYALPLLRGRHADLKAISGETLAGLLAGGYEHAVDRYQVIDCRYPYEFAGGHISGARNLYTAEQMRELVAAAAQPAPGRSVLVLHCEFSLERGPKLYRYLRSTDRASNKEAYPALCYPEIYLLEGGYSAFHRRHAELCAPRGYTPMLHPRHRAELSAYRAADERPPRQKCRSRLPM